MVLKYANVPSLIIGSLIGAAVFGWLGDDTINGYHGSVYLEDANIPLGFLGGGFTTGVVETPVSADEVASSILGALGVPLGQEMQGRNLLQEPVAP